MDMIENHKLKLRRQQVIAALSRTQKRVLKVALANVVATSQHKTSATLSVVSIADFRESFPSLTLPRAREVLLSILIDQWKILNEAPASPARPAILWSVQTKGQTLIVEFDDNFLTQHLEGQSDIS